MGGDTLTLEDILEIKEALEEAAVPDNNYCVYYDTESGAVKMAKKINGYWIDIDDLDEENK